MKVVLIFGAVCWTYILANLLYQWGYREGRIDECNRAQVVDCEEL